jgi:hypothetical protein
VNHPAWVIHAAELIHNAVGRPAGYRPAFS